MTDLRTSIELLKIRLAQYILLLHVLKNIEWMHTLCCVDNILEKDKREGWNSLVILVSCAPSTQVYVSVCYTIMR